MYIVCINCIYILYLYQPLPFFKNKQIPKQTKKSLELVIVIITVHVIELFYVVMHALFDLSVHIYYLVNCNAKTQMSYLCALIK